MIEVAVVSAAGGVMGWLAGLVASRLALLYFTEAGAQIELRLPLAVFAIAVAMLTGIVSVYPVIRAFALGPSEAVRYVWEQSMAFVAVDNVSKTYNDQDSGIGGASAA